MNANPILLQKKYTRIVALYAEKTGISLDDALKVFYHSEAYRLQREVADMDIMIANKAGKYISTFISRFDESFQIHFRFYHLM